MRIGFLVVGIYTDDCTYSNIEPFAFLDSEDNAKIVVQQFEKIAEVFHQNGIPRGLANLPGSFCIKKIPYVFKYGWPLPVPSGEVEEIKNSFIESQIPEEFRNYLV